MHLSRVHPLSAPRRRVGLASLLTIIGFGLAACSDGSTEVRTFPLSVRVEYPATYATLVATNARVVLTSTERNTSDSAVADAQGVATFPRVLPGTYVVSSAIALTADQAFALTGQRTALTLNALSPARAILTAPTEPVRQSLSGSRVGDLVIKEVYFTGSRTPSGGTYFSDQFIEIYNNATDTIFTDGLLIADTYGPAGQINPTTLPTPFQAQPDAVYASSIWQIPGTGRQYPLLPGQSLIIAQDGIDHRSDPNGNPASPVNLSTADWETYNERPDGRDLDAPAVRNLTRLVFRGGFDWLLPVFGPGVVIFRAPNVAGIDSVLVPGTTSTWASRIPNAQVIDAFEALQNGNSGPYKRVPAALDAGYVFASGTYTSQSARRKVATVIGTRRVLQDTNNGSNDFTVITPPTPKGFGTP